MDKTERKEETSIYYNVRMEITLDATSPREAAKATLYWLQELGCKPCFEVRKVSCDDPIEAAWEMIDLDEPVYE